MRKKLSASRANAGFTLLELSVVIVIVSLVTSMAVMSGISVVSTARVSATQQKMKRIDDALMQFRQINDRLPCPADLTIPSGSANYGLEAANPGICTGGTPAANFTATGVTNTSAAAAEGALPALTLGLPADMMVDGWGNRLRYAVDVDMTVTGAFSTLPAGCTVGAITVNDGNGAARSTSAIYALISHGPNGHGAYTKNGATVSTASASADELTNCHCDGTGATTTSSGVQTTSPATYVQKQPAYDAGHTGVASYYFDDLVTYKERGNMQTAWDLTGSCPSAYVSIASGGSEYINIYNAATGAYTGQTGHTTGHALGCCAGGLALDASGNLWASDSQPGTDGIKEYSATGAFVQVQGGGSGTADGQFNTPKYLAFDASGNLWVSDPGLNRVQKFTVSSGSLTWAMTLGGGSGCAGVMTSTTSCSVLNGNASCCAPNATSCSCSASTGAATGMFSSPAGVAFDKNGNVWIADTNNHRVQEFSSAGAYMNSIGTGYQGAGGTIGTQGNGSAGQLQGPAGIAFDAGGNLWVTNSQSPYSIEEFNPNTYAWIRTIPAATSGSADAALAGATGISFDSQGRLWIADTGNNRALKWDTNGNWLMTIAGSGSSCLGERVSATACAPINGNSTCCSPAAATCTCNSGLGPRSVVVTPTSR